MHGFYAVFLQESIKFMSIFKRNKTEDPNVRRIVISSSAKGMYIDTEGVAAVPYCDVIEVREFKRGRTVCSFVVPGLMEWYERYLKFQLGTEEDFDWKEWHHDGLLFTRQIYQNMPRNIQLRYEAPAEDQSGTVEGFDVSEEGIDSLLESIGECGSEREPVMYESVVTSVKEEGGSVHIRITIKGEDCSYIYRMSYQSLVLLRDFLEKIALCEGEPVIWESQSFENGMYFYPQTIGDLKFMGQFQVFTSRRLVFSAYVNSREFVRSVYRSIMTHVGTLADNAPHKAFHSNLLECYINDSALDHLSFYRNSPRLANLVSPAFITAREFCLDIYDKIQKER